MTSEKRILLEDHTALPSGYKADNLMHESLIHEMVCQCTCTVVRIIYCLLDHAMPEVGNKQIKPRYRHIAID